MKAAYFYGGGDNVAASMRGWAELMEGHDEAAITWFEKAWALSGAEPWDVRSFIENARRPGTGKAFLDQKMTEQSGLPGSMASGGLGGLWYLALGYLQQIRFYRPSRVPALGQ